MEQCSFWSKKMKMEGWKALAKQIRDRQLAKDFARDMLDLENLLSDVQSKWRALSQELENDHKPKEFVLILIKIYNNQGRLLPLTHRMHQLILIMELHGLQLKRQNHLEIWKSKSSLKIIVNNDYYVPLSNGINSN